MKTLQNLVFALFFVSLTALTVQAAGGGGEESNQHAGKRHNDFYPKKPADRALADRPAMVELLEPKALSQVSGNQVTLKWKPVENADSYRVQVATDPNFKWLLNHQDFYKDTNFNVQGLEAGKKYYWRVYAMKLNNDSGYISSFSNMSSFEVK